MHVIRRDLPEKGGKMTGGREKQTFPQKALPFWVVFHGAEKQKLSAVWYLKPGWNYCTISTVGSQGVTCDTVN